MNSDMSENEMLNRMPPHIEKACVNCGRKYPDTILNIEGIIHHKEKPRCLDTRLCNRKQKKIKAQVER